MKNASVRRKWFLVAMRPAKMYTLQGQLARARRRGQGGCKNFSGRAARDRRSRWQARKDERKERYEVLEVRSARARASSGGGAKVICSSMASTSSTSVTPIALK